MINLPALVLFSWCKAQTHFPGDDRTATLYRPQYFMLLWSRFFGWLVGLIRFFIFKPESISTPGEGIKTFSLSFLFLIDEWFPNRDSPFSDSSFPTVVSPSQRKLWDHKNKLNGELPRKLCLLRRVPFTLFAGELGNPHIKRSPQRCSDTGFSFGKCG